eukprot:6207828-Pleurochrysis_carterae.AAC.3
MSVPRVQERACPPSREVAWLPQAPKLADVGALSGFIMVLFGVLGLQARLADYSAQRCLPFTLSHLDSINHGWQDETMLVALAHLLANELASTMCQLLRICLVLVCLETA